MFKFGKSVGVPSQTPGVIRFGVFEMDITGGELRKNGVRLKLQSQPFRVLEFLALRSGVVVPREELYRLLSDHSTYDSKHALNNAIQKIRETLNDSSDSPRFIETLPGRGYRFLPNVELIPKANTNSDLRRGTGDPFVQEAAQIRSEFSSTDSVRKLREQRASESQPSINTAQVNSSQFKQDTGLSQRRSLQPVAGASAARTLGSSRKKMLYGFAVLLTVLAIPLAWLKFRSAHSRMPPIMTERQLTRNTPENRVLNGKISPDGKYLLFADTKGLHLSTIDTGELHDVPLTAELQTHLWEVTWFPDGERVLLMSQSETDGHVLWATSVFGDTPRKLRTHSREAVVSPQGDSIAFTIDDGREVWVMGADGENARKILASENEQFTVLAWSPSGKRLAYIKSRPTGGAFGGSIETVTLEKGTPTSVLSDPLLFSFRNAAPLLWLPDGRLIFALREGSSNSEANLWKIMVEPQTGKVSGAPARITNWYGFGPWTPSVSKDGARLVLTKGRKRDDVYVAEIKEAGTRLDPPRRLTFSDSKDLLDGWTRDSKAVLFQSDRSGRLQIYRQQLGQGTAQLLVRGSDDENDAKLTPDGAWILYFATAYGSSPQTSVRLMRSPSTGEAPHEQVLEIPFDPFDGFDCPSYPSSSCVLGRMEQDYYVFYALDPLRGLGKEVARIRGTTGYWSISPDGTRIAVAIASAIRILDLRSGESRSLKIPWGVWSLSWTVDGSALFVAAQSKEYLLVRIDLDGNIRVLLNRGRDQWLGCAWPSPDGHYLAFSQQSWDSNLWLIENF